MIVPKKSLSQNFIIDKNICRKIIKQTIIKNKQILEIGPGHGFLTDIILENNPQKLIIVEKDSKLVKLLREKYKNNRKIIIIENNILNFDLNKFKNLTIISNLPYNISTKIILYLLNYKMNIIEMIFMIQKEVSLKFDYNLPKMNKYKFLTRISSDYKRCFDVSSNVFYPKPKINSTVVKFKITKNNFDIKNAIDFSNIIFKNVRKKIKNNFKNKKNKKIFDKRVNELSIEELLYIYNFF